MANRFTKGSPKKTLPKYYLRECWKKYFSLVVIAFGRHFSIYLSANFTFGLTMRLDNVTEKFTGSEAVVLV